jgi:hypothetical protein
MERRCDEIGETVGRLSDFWRRRPSPDPSPGIFTGYVRSLDARGEPPDSQAFQELLAALRGALRAELQKRGLWEAPPSYLGVYGWRRWEEGTDGGALEELLAECYFYIFVTRLRSLQAQLQAKPNLEGLVFLNIRHFLHERQRDHDPLGSQVFEVLWAAVQAAVSAGELHILAGDRKIRNDTVLGFERGADPAAILREDLRSVAVRWNNELLPDLITLRGRRQEEIVTRLRHLLAGLREEGIAGFRFKDLIDPLKADVRSRWAAVVEIAEGDVTVEKGNGEPPRLLRIVSPDTSYEEKQAFRRLVGCVLERLAVLEVRKGTREHLEKLWHLVRIQAQGAVEGPLSGAQRALAEELAEEENPSYRKIAEALDIPRDRLRDLYRTLGQLLNGCRALHSGGAGVLPLPGRYAAEAGGAAS